ncbi:MAG: response regulator [Candidatus Omnitrophica bacterium]|nr:response regulator [Candidatus Omnitrophota bacterium]
MSKRILIVDDEADILEIVKARLMAAGYDVFTAEDGLAGLAMAKNEKPDLIILDIMMPKMDGYTALRELRKNADTEKIPVLMLSVKEKSKMEDMLYFQNISDYMEKPFDSYELLEKVKKILQE